MPFLYPDLCNGSLTNEIFDSRSGPDPEGVVVACLRGEASVC